MTEEISNKTTNEYREKVEKLRKSFSAVEYYLSNARDSIAFPPACGAGTKPISNNTFIGNFVVLFANNGDAKYAG
ncbi:MAG: hypothetical protein NTU74_21605 [Deltaproteobacteria bacterium]|nr:hypothetical protein [Deltaproteobacteria bacterium]